MFKGSLVAIITPFRNGRLDEEALGRLIEWQIAEGTHGIVPCGTTGESATLSHDEHRRVIEFTVSAVNQRVPVVAGTGSNSTEEAIALTRHARQAGADGALLITPYYNKPTQEGLYRHYRAIAESVDLPLMLYNIPGRTSVNMLPATVARLTHLPTIVSIKEGSGSIQQMDDVLQLCGDRLTVLSGDDAMTLPLMALGGHGAVSVVANVAPRESATLVTAASKGDFAQARMLHRRLVPLVNALFLETNPIPVKTALALMGRCGDEMRLPLCGMQGETKEKLAAALKKHGLI
ncbi:MAG TPA: 4-hydroxy-tetrahydrodipicolinate synthase [Nitrospiria bacterium]|nr:4-hydroxy-tetrahydrodipicolinate synthase [Nitrospiria bacterium]